MSSSSALGLEAMIVDGATFRSTKDYIAIESKANLFVSFTTRIMYASAQWFGKQNPPVPMSDSIRIATTTQFLFIAAGKEKNEIEYNQFFHQQIPNLSELWIVPEVGHIKAFETYPEEYEERVKVFFETYLE